MKELLVHHLSAKGRLQARVRVSYRLDIGGAQAQEWEGPFRFTISDDELSLIRWYLEEYLHYPWGEFRKRAQEVEARLECATGAQYDPLSVTAAVLGSVAVGVASNVLYDLSKGVLTRRGLRRRTQISQVTQPDGTRVLVITMEE